jgi:hypothetical protein
MVDQELGPLTLLTSHHSIVSLVNQDAPEAKEIHRRLIDD